MTKPNIDELKSSMKKKRTKKAGGRPFGPKDMLDTGSTMLNIAISGRPDGGFLKGRYFFIVGDTSSGKTFLTLTCFSEACRNPHFKDYRLIHDNVEDGALMDLARFFGTKAAERIEPPARYEDGEPKFSTTIEDFYFNIDDALNDGTPFIYVLDSMDGLSSLYEGEKFQERKTASRQGKKGKGDFGDGKAKINSSSIRQIRSRLQRPGSILIIVNQTRDNVGGGIFEPKKIRSGGHALSFYAHVEIWSSVAGQIKKTVKGSERQVGMYSRLRIKKNRITGRLRTVVVPIYHSYGIDDLGSCVEYLLKEKHWKKGRNSTKFNATEFDFEGSQEELIAHIQEEGLEKDLRSIVGSVWNEIEEQSKLSRKPRYK